MKKNISTHEQQIHSKNVALHKVVSGPGLIAPRHSYTISRLLDRVNLTKENLRSKPALQFQQDDLKSLQSRIQELEREEAQLKKQMIRMSEVVKKTKNAKLSIEVRCQTLAKQLQEKQRQVQNLQQKVSAAFELNNFLLGITEKVLCCLPQYEVSCHSLQGYIHSARGKLELKVEEKTSMSIILEELCQKLDSFWHQVEEMRSYQNKVMSNLAQAHLQTKSITERLAAVNTLNIQQMKNFRSQVGNISNLIKERSARKGKQPQDSDEDDQEKQLTLVSDVFQYTYLPDSAPRINKIFADVSMLFEQHIHLLESQKMEYQFTKNKKLIACQQFQCQICENYEKIVSQTFTIVREAFKEIKFQFLKQIKQISDVSEIPILI